MINKNKPHLDVGLNELRRGDVLLLKNDVVGVMINADGVEHKNWVSTRNGRLACVLLTNALNEPYLEIAMGFADNIRRGRFEVIGRAEDLEITIR